jgi:catechol-2,3-dioxygenase
MFLSRTYIDLEVHDADRSATFYEALLGAPPAQRGDHMAVFEFDSPPLVLTLKRPRSASPSSRGRFALVVPQPEHVGNAAIALRRVGVRLRLEDQGIETSDPDGNAWRVRFVPSAKDRTVIPL